MDEIIENKLTKTQKMKKKFYMMFANKNSANKLPDWLKNDTEMLERILLKCKNINEKIDVVEAVPYAINLLDIKSLESIMLYENKCTKYINLLPSNTQMKILSQIDGNIIDSFPNEAVIKLYIDAVEKGNKLKKFKIDTLNENLQLMIALIDNSYLKDMSPNVQKKFVNNNPLLFQHVTDKIRDELENDNSIFQYLCISWREIVNHNTIDDYNWWKSAINHRGMDITDQLNQKNDPNLILQLLKYDAKCYNFSLRLGNEDINPIVDVIKLELEHMRNGEELKSVLDEIYNKFDYDAYGKEKDRYNKEILKRFIKIGLNKDIINCIDYKEIKDYIKNPNRKKLLDIIEKTYGSKAKKVLEERPRIDLDDIPNLYIFNENIMNEFSIGDIHNFLSYYNNGVNVISDLATNPEKMKQYKKFNEITRDYFEYTAYDLDKKLLAFADFYELMDSIDKIPVFSDNQLNNLQMMLEDYCGGGLIFKPKDWNDIEKYEEIKDKLYNDAIEKTTSSDGIKELIFKRFFGTSKISNMYATLISDYNIMTKKLLTENELDYMELIDIIDNIEDVKILKNIYNELLKDKDIINPESYKEILEKRKKHYYEFCTNSLTSPEDAIKRFENGEEGISVDTYEGINVITFSGADFYVYVSNLQSFMSNIPESMRIDNNFERWTTLEDGVSTISGCLFGKQNLNQLTESGVSFRVGFSGFESEQIVGMGKDDINVTHEIKSLNPEVLDRQICAYPKKIVEESALLQNSKNGPEIAMFRRQKDSRKIKEDSYGGRIMPTYIFSTKEDFEENKKRYIKEAKEFNTKFILIIDKDAYKEIEIPKSKTSEKIIERKDTKFIKKYKEIGEGEDR